MVSVIVPEPAMSLAVRLCPLRLSVLPEFTVTFPNTSSSMSVKSSNVLSISASVSEPVLVLFVLNLSPVVPLSPTAS